MNPDRAAAKTTRRAAPGAAGRSQHHPGSGASRRQSEAWRAHRPRTGERTVRTGMRTSPECEVRPAPSGSAPVRAAQVHRTAASEDSLPGELRTRSGATCHKPAACRSTGTPARPARSLRRAGITCRPAAAMREGLRGAGPASVRRFGYPRVPSPIPPAMPASPCLVGRWGTRRATRCLAIRRRGLGRPGLMCGTRGAVWHPARSAVWCPVRSSRWRAAGRAGGRVGEQHKGRPTDSGDRRGAWRTGTSPGRNPVHGSC